MLHVLDVTFPFFALVLVGYLVARARWMPMDAIPALNVFVLYFALPCMLFRFAAGTPVARMLSPGIGGLWLACAAAMVAIIVAVTRPRHIGWNDAAFGALVGAFPNNGFMGVPLLVDLLGPKAAGPAIVALAVDMVVTSSACIALSRLGTAGTQGLGRTLRTAMAGMAVNPLPWAIVSGTLVSASGVAVPHVLMKPVTMLADAASPVALFTLGAVLARARQPALDAAVAQAAIDDIPRVVACKLLLHPVLVLALGTLMMRLPAGPDRFTVHVLTLLAALPGASNVPMLAERFGADAGRIARIVLVTTALAFVTFSGSVSVLARVLPVAAAPGTGPQAQGTGTPPPAGVKPNTPA